MEFDFDVHKIFLEPITKLDKSLIPSRRPLISSSEAQRQITTVIDEIGKASAKAQKLPAPITSASRMQTNQHHLYILKDCTPQTAGRGSVIGFLKVGYKKLFVLDHKGSHVEAEPLCILDFYIHESLQRNGFGKELFTYMLRNEQVEPQHLAIDRPSDKFLSFLKKHYNLRSTIPQVNNFVVFEGFFRACKAPVKKLPAKRAEGDIKPYSLSEREFLKHEEGLPWPFSQSQATLNRASSLGSSPTRVSSRQTPSEEDFMRSLRACRPHSLQRTVSGDQEDSSQRRRTSREMNNSRGLMAQRSSYSRHLTPSCTLVATGQMPAEKKEKQSITLNGGNRNIPADDLYVKVPGRTPLQLAGPPSTEHGPGVTLVGLQNDKDGGKSGPRSDPKSLWNAQQSWTVLGTVTNAQWVKRKQELRGTRPW